MPDARPTDTDTAAASPRTDAGPRTDAMLAATGRLPAQWTALLDAAGARTWDHGRIVAHLAQVAPELSGWWQQSVTVEYERLAGLRAVGETPTGFQVSARRTVDAPAARLWSVLAADPTGVLGGTGVTAGGVASDVLAPGVTLSVGERVAGGSGVSGSAPARAEVRTVRDGTRVRLAWHEDDWARPAIVQVELVPSGDRTVVQVAVERLPDAAAREAARDRWRSVLARWAKTAG